MSQDRRGGECHGTGEGVSVLRKVREGANVLGRVSVLGQVRELVSWDR